MKNLRTTLVGVCITLSIATTAQENRIPINEPDLNKPKLFQHLPDVIAVNTEDLNSLLNSPVGKSINVNLADRSAATAFRIEGEVVAETKQADNSIQTISIRSSNFPGASVTFSKIINTDGTIRYSGRIISFKHGDLLELQNRNGQLVFIKRNLYDLVNE